MVMNLVGAALSSWLLSRLLRTGRWVFDICFGITFFHVSWLAMTQKRHGVLVLVFFLFSLMVLAREWVARTLRAPYFDSGRRWWESHPKTIPGAKAFVSEAAGGGEAEVLLTNLGPEGCFVFFPGGKMSKKPQRIRIVPEQGQEYTAPVEVVFVTRDKYGVGLQFSPGVAQNDGSKDLHDMIFKMRSLGYVD